MESDKLSGQSLIEILIVIALTAIMLPALFYALIASREGRPQQAVRFRASQLLKETQDSLRIIRENGWSAVATPGTYHPVRSGNTWILAAGPETINGITRQIVISNVNRLNQQIVTSGGSNDPSTKQAVITVSWTTPHTTTISSTLYLSRYLENAIYTQTAADEFDTGTHTGTTVTQNGDGEVVLGAGGLGSWCTPELTIATLDLPKNGVANAVTAIEGQAFAATGDNASGVSFASIDINNSSPPAATIQGTFDGYKTNDVFGDSTYAYIATDNNSEEIIIINLATLAKAGWFDASGSTDAETIYVRGSTGYMTHGTTLRTFNIGSASQSKPQLDSITLAGNATELAVAGNYAYVTFRNSSAILQIINIANPSNIFSEQIYYGSYSAAVDIVINDTQTRAYVALEQSSIYPEFLIFELINGRNYGNLLGAYHTGSMSPKGLAIVPGNKAIIVGTNGEEYQVVNIVNESNPTRCGGLEINAGVNGIASVLESDGDAYSYIITSDASSEFKIIEGGPGGTFSTNGTYESATFDIGQSLAFNRILPTATSPVNTSITYQIAIADPVSGSCTGANYVYTGPDGTTNTSYSANDLIAFSDDGVGYENPGRCFRYRANLVTSDSNSTPIFEQIIINYSY